jgi:photosystem II stability/assembly factor-like uncharacterized protein
MSFSPLRRSISRCTVAALCALASVDSSAQHAADPSSTVAAAPWADPDKASAEVMPFASRSLLLDAVRCANHYLVVGSRGEVLVSDDAKQWRQIVTPTRSTLTAASAIDAHVWAVGHDGVILHSADGGEHWTVQRDDPLQTAPQGGDAARNPQQGAPLLDVLFLDTHRGFAVGAYSLALSTTDGGASWQPMTVAAADAANDDEIDEPKPKNAANDKSIKSDKQTFSSDELKVGQEATPHLNAIAKTGSGALFIVGERGSAFRSRDNGATWQRLQLPYDGSMFGVIGYDADRVLAFGLRGHVYESSDLGDHWQAVSTETQLSLMGGAALSDGGAVIVGANGIVLTRAKFGEALRADVNEPAGIIANVLPLESGGVLLVGENGVSIHSAKH